MADEQIVIAVEVSQHRLRPWPDAADVGAVAASDMGQFPGRHLADGGFASAEDIEWAHDNGIEVYCPPTQSKHGTDPYRPRPGDGPGMLAWRARMGERSGSGRNTNPARSANASMPAGAIGASDNCSYAASKRSVLSRSSTPSPTISCKDIGLPVRKHKGKALGRRTFRQARPTPPRASLKLHKL